MDSYLQQLVAKRSQMSSPSALMNAIPDNPAPDMGNTNAPPDVNSMMPPTNVQGPPQPMPQQSVSGATEMAHGWKGLLANFMQGMGDAALKSAGLPTSYEKQIYAQKVADKAADDDFTHQMSIADLHEKIRSNQAQEASTQTQQHTNELLRLLGISEENKRQDKAIAQQNVGLAASDERTNKQIQSNEGIAAQRDATNNRRISEMMNRQNNDAQVEKGYQFHSKAIEDIQKPLSQQLDRIGRLEEALKQRTPQADSLVAPELLTAMAGGQGSGLRMNEAEIARIIGGRSAWEALRAKIQHYNTDPSKALSLTDAQRGQVQQLLTAVKDKYNKKNQILDDARNQLINVNDTTSQKQIFFNARKALTNLDQGSSSTSTGAPPKTWEEYMQNRK